MKKVRLSNYAKKEVGRSPGSLVFQGTQKMGEASIRIMTYNLDRLEEEIITPEILASRKQQDGCITWINISGIHDAELVKLIGEQFCLHPLLLEDVMNATQRPKLEVYEDYLFVVVKMLDYIEKDSEVLEEQVTMVIQSDLVITFQEQEGDIFDQVRNRLRLKKGKIRGKGSDYLAYALLDAIVDEYFVILDALGAELDILEEELMAASDPMKYLERMQSLKREIIGFRRYIGPTREVISGLARIENEIVKHDTMVFLRDVHDHAIQVSETIDSYREVLASIQDLHLSVVNNKMNEVMKVLAGISTIFLPMTLVAGIYGMNFEFMPELHNNWGYPASLGLMGVIGVGMYFYFRTRKWF